MFIILILGGVGAVATIILKISEIILEKRYSSYGKSLDCKSAQINEKYLSNVRLLSNQVDELYLHSLDPAHRELVLMRRDQEQQHQQLMRGQRRLQETVEEEQRKIRRAQEELLEIEKRTKI